MTTNRLGSSLSGRKAALPMALVTLATWLGAVAERSFGNAPGA
jgi:hypothetical protein